MIVKSVLKVFIAQKDKELSSRLFVKMVHIAQKDLNNQSIVL
jgi:hypothetical protein